MNRSNSSSNFKDNTPETSYENSENGHKIAYDPRDISESTERNKQPKLTLMEEVLLLGLKDKQVSCPPLLSLFPCDHARRHRPCPRLANAVRHPGLPVLLERQHFLRPPRVHRLGISLPGPHQHAKGRLETAFPPT